MIAIAPAAAPTAFSTELTTSGSSHRRRRIQPYGCPPSPMTTASPPRPACEPAVRPLRQSAHSPQDSHRPSSILGTFRRFIPLCPFGLPPFVTTHHKASPNLIFAGGTLS